jgi:hypothetical protein
MKLNLSKLLYYALPAALAIFIMTQTIFPLFSKAGDHVSIQTKLTSVKNNVRKPATSEFKTAEFALSNAPNGVYYTYKTDYTCKRAGSKNNIPSHADSFAVLNGQICNMGDACAQQPSGCSMRLPEGMEFTKNFVGLIYKNQKFNKQNSPIPESCVMPSCGMPADNCRFDEMAPLDENGCPQGCGTIVCKLNAEQCPILNCAAPPQNCYYDSRNAGVDEKGCARGCGVLVCDTINSKEFKCPALSCTNPPENCSYDDSAGRDSNGCKTSCGELKCKHVNPKAVACLSEPVCSEPPAGCFYAGTPAVDDKGCRTGCGSMACKKNTPNQCEQPVCEPPTEFCRYDGNSPLDFKGCSTGCGNLICNSEVPL